MTTEQPKIVYDENGDARSFIGREAVDVFACAAIASALRLYAKARIRVNRAYTPTAMLAAATRYTGIKFKRGQYLEAAEALSARVQSEKARIAALGAGFTVQHDTARSVFYWTHAQHEPTGELHDTEAGAWAEAADITLGIEDREPAGTEALPHGHHGAPA